MICAKRRHSFFENSAAVDRPVLAACTTTASAKRRGSDGIQEVRHAAACPAAGDLAGQRRDKLVLVECGSKSQCNTQPAGWAWPLIARLTSSTTGPDTPKCVNNSDPRGLARQADLGLEPRLV